jgi:hypothetical protein
VGRRDPDAYTTKSGAGLQWYQLFSTINSFFDCGSLFFPFVLLFLDLGVDTILSVLLSVLATSFWVFVLVGIYQLHHLNSTAPRLKTPHKGQRGRWRRRQKAFRHRRRRKVRHKPPASFQLKTDTTLCEPRPSRVHPAIHQKLNAIRALFTPSADRLGPLQCYPATLGQLNSAVSKSPTLFRSNKPWCCSPHLL